MTTVNIHQAKTYLSSLIEKVLSGEKVIIAKSGKPIVEITPYKPKKIKRRAGSLKDKIWISDDFNKPLEDFNDYME